MSGITNLIITFYDGTENGASIIRNRLKQHVGEHIVKIICNRGVDGTYLNSIKEFYDDTEVISVDEWDYYDVNRAIEGLISNNAYSNKRKIIEITTANQVEVIISCKMSYVYGAEVFCGSIKGEEKKIDAPRMVDVSKLGNIKRAILKVVEDNYDHTIDDIHRTILDKKYGNYNNLSQKHVRTNVAALVDEGLLEDNGRIKIEYGRKRTKYRITYKGKISMTIYRQKDRRFMSVE